MSKKVIALISDHPSIKDNLESIDSKRRFANKQVVDTMKKCSEDVSKIQESLKTDSKELWLGVVNELKKAGRLPESFELETDNLTFNLVNNTISVPSKEGDSEESSLLREIYNAISGKDDDDDN